MEYWYRAHGLLLRSTLELPLPAGAPGTGTPDLILRCGEDRRVPDDPPDGHVLAQLCAPDGRLFYSLVVDGDRTVLRFPALCEFRADRAMAEVTAHLHPGTDRGLLAVLATGTLLAVHLLLRHELVLHASAVRRDGCAIAFVGASGMGKSTLAAALCRDTDCSLVADDVLRVVRSADGAVSVHPGSTESRLRLSARDLADGAAPEDVRATADGRLALRPRACTDGPLPLAACVVPRPSRDVDELAVKRLAPPRGLLRLAQFPRVIGWCEPGSTARAFQALADLVERVPIYEATIPWGPPFRAEVLAALLDAVVPAARR